MFAADGVIDIGDHRLVFLNPLKDIEETFLPGGISLFSAQSLGRLVQQRPFQQIVNIAEVIVKGLAVDLAVLYDVDDRDFIQRLFGQQLFQ